MLLDRPTQQLVQNMRRSNEKNKSRKRNKKTGAQNRIKRKAEKAKIVLDQARKKDGLYRAHIKVWTAGKNSRKENWLEHDTSSTGKCCACYQHFDDGQTTHCPLTHYSHSASSC